MPLMYELHKLSSQHINIMSCNIESITTRVKVPSAWLVRDFFIFEFEQQVSMVRQSVVSLDGLCGIYLNFVPPGPSGLSFSASCKAVIASPYLLFGA